MSNRNARGVNTPHILSDLGYSSIDECVSDLYQQGYTPTAIADKTSFSRERIYQSLRALGIKTRGQNKGVPRGTRIVK